MKYIKFGIVFSIIFLIASSFGITYTNAQTADGACSGGALSLEQNCTFQQGSSRLNGKCQVKNQSNPSEGLTCRTSLGSSCSGDTCQNGLACINQVCSSPRGNKTEGQSCSGNGNECVAGLECRNFTCTREVAITGGNSNSGSSLGTGSGEAGQTGGSPTATSTNSDSTSQTASTGGTTGSETGLVKCGTSRDCTICDIFILIRDVFNFALGLLASLAVLSVVIGGVYVLTSAGNSGAVSTGYSIITNAVIGLLLVMASFLLFSFLLVGLGFQEQNFSAVLTFQPGRIFEVKCDTASTFNDNGSNGGGAATTGGGSGNVGSLSVACLDATNISDELSAVMRAISFYEGAADRSGYLRLVGGKMYPQSQNIHPGAENPNLYNTTGLNSDTYGRFQMLSTTWASWAAAAGVPTVRSGTYTIREGTFAYYNMAPQYQDAAVAGTLRRNGITDCQSFRNSSYRCQWASIAGCSQQNDKTRSYPWADTCAKMLADEKTGACKQ